MEGVVLVGSRGVLQRCHGAVEVVEVLDCAQSGGVVLSVPQGVV